MGGDESFSGFPVIIQQAVLYRSDIRDDAPGWQVAIDLPENPDGLVEADCIDQQVGLKIPDLIVTEEAMRAEKIFQPVPVHVIYSDFVIQAE
jgi:hypothetical protein